MKTEGALYLHDLVHGPPHDCVNRALFLNQIGAMNQAIKIGGKMIKSAIWLNFNTVVT